MAIAVYAYGVVFDRHFHHVYCEETERGKQQVNMAKQGFLPIVLRYQLKKHLW